MDKPQNAKLMQLVLDSIAKDALAFDITPQELWAVSQGIRNQVDQVRRNASISRETSEKDSNARKKARVHKWIPFIVPFRADLANGDFFPHDKNTYSKFAHVFNSTVPNLHITLDGLKRLAEESEIEKYDINNADDGRSFPNSIIRTVDGYLVYLRIVPDERRIIVLKQSLDQTNRPETDIERMERFVKKLEGFCVYVSKNDPIFYSEIAKDVVKNMVAFIQCLKDKKGLRESNMSLEQVIFDCDTLGILHVPFRESGLLRIYGNLKTTGHLLTKDGALLEVRFDESMSFIHSIIKY